MKELGERNSKRIRVKCTYGLGLICFIGLVPWGPVQAQRQDSRNESPEDTTDLKRDISTLLARQEQLIEQVDELKHLVSANATDRTAPQPQQPPSTIGVHGEAFRGDRTAHVAVIEYADFECPFCGGYEQQTYPQILENYIKTGKVKLFYRDLPLPMHPHAMSAARAAHCAGEQGKYWEMHDDLFANQTALGLKDISDRAQSLGIDAKKFSECLSSEKYTDDIRKSMAEAQQLGISGTPTFFLGTIGPNGDVVNIQKKIVGAHPYADFQSALDELLVSKKPEAVSTH